MRPKFQTDLIDLGDLLCDIAKAIFCYFFGHDLKVEELENGHLYSSYMRFRHECKRCEFAFYNHTNLATVQPMSKPKLRKPRK